MLLMLYLTGNQKKEIDLSEEQAKKIKKEWEDDKIPNSHKFSISENFSIIKGDIKRIQLSKEYQEDNHYLEIAKEYEAEKREIRKLPTDKRFCYKIFRFFWRWSLGFKKDPDEKIIKLAKEYSKQYFEKHPDHTKEPLILWRYMCKKEGIKIPEPEPIVKTFNEVIN